MLLYNNLAAVLKAAYRNLPKIASLEIADDPEYLKWYGVRQRIRAAAREGLPTHLLELAEASEPSITAALSRYEVRAGDRYRVGNWIPTITGRRFWLRDPRASEVEPYDVAYGMARIPRYNTATSGRPYVVGQHLVLCSYLVEKEFALHGLLHDAHEYMGMDVTSPLKRELGDAYAVIEHGLKEVVAERFGIVWTPEATAAVKRIDNILLATEVNTITPHKVVFGELPAVPLNWRLDPLPEEEVFFLFAERLNELMGYQVL